jgi:phosphate acetyltransferase
MDQSILANRTFNELEIGKSASLVRIVGRDNIELFAAVSGDVNPAHLDAAFAATDLFGHIVAHGMWTGALVSAVLGAKLPGPARSISARTSDSAAPWHRETRSP